jgi:MoxR-like ATPase
MQLKPTDLERAAGLLNELRNEVGKAVVGQSQAVGQILGKTLLVRSLAKAMSLQYARVQFTPDLMPSDITGHAVLDARGGDANSLGTLRVHRGPVFTNLLLADEINRAPAKTQASLLEVMQEYQVTLEGQTHALPRPFMVLATQNPIDTEGTYPLPEAQLDRFLFKIDIGYPPHDEETAIVKRTTEQQTGDQFPLEGVAARVDERSVLTLQRMVAFIRADDKVIDYAVRLVRATRSWPGLATGAGPRAAIALVRAARATALMQSRDFVTPDDIKLHALPALRHRVLLAPDAQLEGRSVGELLEGVLDSVEAPRL